jgi:hypothetical protein
MPKLTVACATGTDLVYQIGKITGDPDRGTLGDHNISVRMLKEQGPKRSGMKYEVEITNIGLDMLRKAFQNRGIQVLSTN